MSRPMPSGSGAVRTSPIPTLPVTEALFGPEPMRAFTITSGTATRITQPMPSCWIAVKSPTCAWRASAEPAVTGGIWSIPVTAGITAMSAPEMLLILTFASCRRTLRFRRTPSPIRNIRIIMPLILLYIPRGLPPSYSETKVRKKKSGKKAAGFRRNQAGPAVLNGLRGPEVAFSAMLYYTGL